MAGLVIVGASAMGRETYSYARDCGMEVKGFLDSRFDIVTGFKGYPPILSSVEDYRTERDDMFVCAVGNPQQKMRYVEIIASQGGRFATILHPRAYVGLNVEIGAGCIIAPYAMVLNDTRIGSHVIVNDAATIGHDNEIGDGSTISPGCHLAGRVKVGMEVFVGIGASVIPDIRINGAAVVGAGAVVVRDVAAGTTVAGVPAKVLSSK